MTPERTRFTNNGGNPFDYTYAMEHLVEVVRDLSLVRDLNGLMEIVRRAARKLTNADGATFILREGDNCFYADEDAIGPLWKGKRFPMEICASGWVMTHGEPLAIKDVDSDERIPKEAYQPTFVRSMLMVPIRAANPVGAIGNYWAHPYEPLQKQIKILQALADTTAVALENVQLYSSLEARVKERTAQLEAANQEIHQLSLTDELTGLNNRRGFVLLGNQQLHMARRSQTPAWLLFTDLDGLKPVNDRFGHDAGDRLLCAAAEILREAFRETDILARIGGDEFVVFGAGKQSVENLTARLRSRMEQYNLQQEPGSRLSLSLGVVPIDPSGSDSLDQLLSRADEAMYAMKRARFGEQRNSA
jgi:diguanylate cyclase (GGDEF)-like protein